MSVIPMVDLKAEYAALKEEINAEIQSVLESAQFIGGPKLQALESAVANYFGVRNAIGVSSGTDALHLALRAAGIGEGDEVITSPFTFIATAEAISYIGARPVFVDIDPKTFNIDPLCIPAALTAKTKAVLPVHLYGQPADMIPITEICSKHGLKLIEDCAQSFGAEYMGRKCGALGNAGCFSFYPSKNLGAYGDAGMVITDDDSLAEAIRVYRNHGSQKQYHHSVIGYNSRLDEIQAAILNVKLEHMDSFNNRRRANARQYGERLQGSGLTLPYEDNKGIHVYHQYTIQSEKRDILRAALTTEGISSAIYYPIPLHQQDAYIGNYDGLSFPAAEAAASKVLSLPMSPFLTSAEIDRVCDTLLHAL